MKISFYSIILLISLAGCVQKIPFNSIPQNEEDFFLSKSEIIENYADIKKYHPNYLEPSLRRPTFVELREKWNDPNFSKKEYFKLGVGYGGSLGLAYIMAQGFDPVLSSILVGSLFITNPRPLETYTWKKGKYRIDATFFNYYFGSTQYLRSWNWSVKDESETEEYSDWLTPKSENQLFFGMSFSHGGDAIAEYKNGDEAYGISRNTMFSLGYKFSLPEYSSNIKLSAGIEYSGLTLPESSPKLVQYPIEIIFERRVYNSSLYGGLGLGYIVDPVIHIENSNNISLGSTYSIITQIEYKIHSSSGVGFRYEFISYGNLNGNNISVFLNSYFW